MAGTFPSSTYRGTSIAVESGSSYPLGIDAAINALLRSGGQWAPRSQVTQDMTMRVDPGSILSGTTETEVGSIVQGTVTNGSPNITNVTLTEGAVQGMVIQAYVFVAGVLTQLFPEATTLLNAPTTGALGAATLVASANANGGYTGTATIVVSQGVGLASFTGVTSSGSPIVTTIPAGVTANLLVGMAFTGPGVPAGTFVLSIDSPTQIHMTQNAGVGFGAGSCTCTVPVPAANPRYDRVCRDSVTGALTFTKGVEGANPAVPAIPSTTAVPVCNLYTTTGTTALTHTSNIIDKRGTPGVGAAFGTETLLAAATTTDIGTVASHTVNVGTNAGISITSFGSSASTANPIYVARWTVAGTITNGANILCTGGANISVNAGDVYFLEYMGAGVWRVVSEQDFVNTVLNGSSGHTLTVNGTSGTHSTQIADSAGTLYDAGYLDIPMSSGAPRTSSYAPALVDRGKMIAFNGTSMVSLIPANGSVAFPVGSTVTWLNINVSALSIQITTDILTWGPSGGTGTRSLAQWGQATAYKYDSTHWIIFGSGLS